MLNFRHEDWREFSSAPISKRFDIFTLDSGDCGWHLLFHWCIIVVMASEDAYLQHLVAGHRVPTQVYNLLTPLQNGSTIMNSFLVSVPSLNMSITVHPADSGLNLAKKISVETGEDLNQLVMVTHGYHIMRHIELGEIPGIKDYRDINIGSMVGGMYPYPTVPS
ncbi:hypothetical protein ACFX12_034028 [Malus domestica]